MSKASGIGSDRRPAAGRLAVSLIPGIWVTLVVVCMAVAVLSGPIVAASPQGKGASPIEVDDGSPPGREADDGDDRSKPKRPDKPERGEPPDPPEEPERPETPGVDGQPEPDPPDGQDRPHRPKKPEKPDEPARHEPERPGKPRDPDHPAKRGEPAEPDHPAKPGQNDDEPDRPARPDEPGRSGKPDKGRPDEPGRSGQPDKDRPDQPGKPSKPDHPAKPDKPDGPDAILPPTHDPGDDPGLAPDPPAETIADPPLEPEPAPDAPPDVIDDPAPGPFEIVVPDGSARARPGESVEHQVVLVRRSGAPDAEQTLTLHVSSTEDWSVVILDDGSGTALARSHGDRAEAVALVVAEEASLIVRVTIPEDAVAGTTDTTSLSVVADIEGATDAAMAALVPATADLTTTVAGSVDVLVTGQDLRFGAVSPNGALDPDLGGLVDVSIDAKGASYVAREALRVRVTSDGPWSLACLFDESSATVDGQSAAAMLAWRRSGTSAWTAFASPAGGDATDRDCVADQPAGQHDVAYDIRLRVDWTDPPARIGGTISFRPMLD